jgi:hypothetical protein
MIMIKSTSRRGKQGDPRQAAEAEGLLDARVLALNPARWPVWARARYGVPQPVGEPVEPLTVAEVER